jgi:hypothetical protein
VLRAGLLISLHYAERSPDTWTQSEDNCKSGALEDTGGREERPEQILYGSVLTKHCLTL